MPRDGHVLCLHCQKYMSRTRERAHRVIHRAPLYSPPPRVPSKLRRVFDVEPEQEPDDDILDGMKVNSLFFSNLTSLQGSSANLNVIHTAEDSICARWNSNINTPDSDAEDEENVDIPTHVEEEDGFDWDKFDSGDSLSAWDQLGEGYERDAARVGKPSLPLYLCYR